jgi:hypothetical protein
MLDFVGVQINFETSLAIPPSQYILLDRCIYDSVQIKPANPIKLRLTRQKSNKRLVRFQSLSFYLQPIKIAF